MSPLKTLLSILSLFVVLGILSIVYPEKGISLGSKEDPFLTLRFPALTDIFEKAETEVVQVDSNATPIEKLQAVDPEEALKQMLAATRQKEFTEFSDSLKFYEDFFKEGMTRFDLPNNDPTWFDRFFKHLEQAATDSSVIHIVHYGDSQLEEDRISATIREDLQERFGGGGPGMLPVFLGTPSQTSSYWNNGEQTGALVRHLIFGDTSDLAPHRRYGILAQMADLHGAATINLKKRVDRKGKVDAFPHVGGYATVKVLANKRGNLKLTLLYDSTSVDSVGVNEDGTAKYKTKVKNVKAAAPEVEKMNKLAVYTWKLPDTTSSIKIQMSGNAEIYAISADGRYGVAVDNVAMRGSSGTIFHRIDEELLAESYKAMNAKLIIMEYGGNMVPGMNSNKSKVDWLKNIITKQIKAIQTANPDADIVFIGPADMAKQIDGKWMTYPGLAITIETLRQIALENGLAYWDMHRVMGGNRSMMKWVKQSPPLGSADYVHFTRKGASYMGELFGEALKVHYDHYKFRERHEISNSKLKEIQTFSDSLRSNAMATEEPAAPKAPEAAE